MNPFKLYRQLLRSVKGDPANLDKKMKWYNWVFLVTKILTPIVAVWMWVTHRYPLALFFTLAFVLDMYNIFSLKRRRKDYIEGMKILRKL